MPSTRRSRVSLPAPHWLLLVALVVALAACAPALPQAPITPTGAPVGAGSPGPLQVTDDLGRQVTIAGQPARIVSLAPSNTEILFAVGAGDQVVGITSYCNYPPEAARGREIVGGYTADSLSVEKILSLKPDVVFSAGAIQKSIIEALETAKVPVVVVESRDLDGIYRDIQLVGQITGHASTADRLLQDMQRRVAAVAAIAEKIPAQDRVKVFYEVWDEPLMTAGPNSFVGQIISLSGGINIFDGTQEEYPQVSAETVLERNPDLILGPDSHAEGLTAAKLAARPGWQGVKAVRDGRIYIVNGDMISRSGPRVVDALETMARSLYPDRYK